MELEIAVDKFFNSVNSVNSKYGTDAAGHLTDDPINRAEYYLQAAIIALSALEHKDWYE